MSWRLASFLVLAVVLAGGLAWYERSRPSSRIVALVAALAALAVAGRLVFAPIPNVQATTDVVLFTGYALGAAPGFAVGALAALVSNLWLGQGPWTPWEMAGWGLVGAGGALLAVATNRRQGRIALALACGIAGLAYGALMDFSVMATAGGSFTADRYLAISARSVPFNAAHIAGNIALALAAGPALVRMISRYRGRLEFTWRPQLTAPLVILAMLVPLGLSQPARAVASSGAAAWLARAQNSDGGFGIAPGEGSSAAMTGWAVLGLEAAGRNPLDLGQGSRTPVGYLRANIESITSTGDLERTILALDAAGVNPRDFVSHDLVAKLETRRSSNGSFQNQVNLTAFGVLALRSAGASGASLVPSVSWLAHAQGDDGGWGFQSGVAGDPDSTGAAMQGIAASDPGAGALAAGVHFLRQDQNPDGGWPLGGNGPSNSQSTAWAVQGLIAAGVSPGAVQANKRSGGDYLRARQDADGHYRYSAATDQTPVWVTGQALLAVAGKAFPLAPVPRAPHTAAAGDGHHGDSGAASSGGTTAPSGGEGPAGGTGASTTKPSGGAAPGFSSPNFGGGGSTGAGGGQHDGAGSAGGHSKNEGASGGGTANRRLFAQVGVPKAAVPSATQAGDGGSNTGRGILIGVGALVLVGAVWFGYRRFA